MRTADCAPEDFELLCDEVEDRNLFLEIRRGHSLLERIPEANIRTYAQGRTSYASSDLENAIARLHQDDRPDWIFCFRGAPVLVTELTKHAYTGDNGLQRFARFAAAAECRVPFIYFGPLQRVRDDELDGTGTASPRRLTSNLFAGMRRLSEVRQIPQIFVEWPTDESGLPKSLPFSPARAAVTEIYGELIQQISTILFDAPLCTRGNPLDCAAVADAQAATNALADTTNTRVSEVVFWYSRAELAGLLKSPRAFIGSMNANSYFLKGKPDKLLAEYALSVSKIKWLQHTDGRIEELRGDRGDSLLARLLSHEKFSTRTLVYYTGYKWRSDPHCGVLVNLDYRLCRADVAPPNSERSCGLAVVYPRVTLQPTSDVGKHLAGLSLKMPGGLQALFEARYGVAESKKKMAACLKSAGLFGAWTNTTKQARLFRRYADLVVLNDGIVIGDSLHGWLDGA